MKRRVIKLLLLAVLAVSLVALGQQAWNNSRAKQDQAEAAALVRMDPGFPTTASGDPLPKEAAAIGMSYPELCQRILELSLHGG